MLLAAQSDEWHDPRTLITLISMIVGLAGFLFGLLSHRWTRRESRLESLGKILQPLVRTAQWLMKAINVRRKCEQLKRSYPSVAADSEPAHHINTLIDEYAEHVKLAAEEFSNAETELACRNFRFPDNISRSVKLAHTTLGELGGMVNDGFFDKADLHLAKFGDEYKRITDTARGWRLADPLEGMRKRFSRKLITKNDDYEYELTQKEMDAVLGLLQKRVTTQAHNTFVVHPPKLIINDPAVLQSDELVVRLKNSIFTVVFQDGTAKMLSLPELLVFIFNLVTVTQQVEEIESMISASKKPGNHQVTVSFQFSMQHIMQPQMAKALLDKVAFSDISSD